MPPAVLPWLVRFEPGWVPETTIHSVRANQAVPRESGRAKESDGAADDDGGGFCTLFESYAYIDTQLGYTHVCNSWKIEGGREEQ